MSLYVTFIGFYDWNFLVGKPAFLPPPLQKNLTIPAICPAVKTDYKRNTCQKQIFCSIATIQGISAGQLLNF